MQEATKVKKPINYSRMFFIIAHLALGFFNLAVFYFYCNAQSFVMAFQRRENGVLNWTFDNFIMFFNSIRDEGSILFEAFRNTFMWFGINVILTVLSVFTSYFLYKKVFGHKIFKIVFFIPSLISAIVIANVIEKMVGPQGIIAKLVQKIDNLDYIPELLIDSRYVIKTLIVKQFAFGIMGGMLIWCGTMSRIPESVIESAKLDGVNWLQEMFLIVLPCIMPTVAISICSMVSSIFSASGGEFLYTKGDYGTMTFGTWQYLQVFETSVNSNSHNLVSAVGWITTIITVPLVLATRKIQKIVGEVEY